MPLSKYLEEAFIDLTETLRSPLGKNKTSIPLILTLFVLGIAILLSVGLPSPSSSSSSLPGSWHPLLEQAITPGSGSLTEDKL
jgi:hypothetical protein